MRADGDSDTWSDFLPLALLQPLSWPRPSRSPPVPSEQRGWGSSGPLWWGQKAPRWKTQEFQNRPIGSSSGDTHSTAPQTTDAESCRRVHWVRRDVLEVRDVRNLPGKVKLFSKKSASGAYPADALPGRSCYGRRLGRTHVQTASGAGRRDATCATCATCMTRHARPMFPRTWKRQREGVPR